MLRPRPHPLPRRLWASQQQQSQQLHSDKRSRGMIRFRFTTVLTASFLLISVVLLHSVWYDEDQHHMDQHHETLTQHTKKNAIDSCQLRKYPPHRYYQLSKFQQHTPDFLKDDYIYGKWPILLPLTGKSHAVTNEGFVNPRVQKICVNQSEWHTPTNVHPFADGTNPSIVKLERLKASTNNNKNNNKHGDDLYDTILQHHPTAKYVATACMTNSQCMWKDSDADKARYHLSTKPEKDLKPDTIRTILVLLDYDFTVLAQTSVTLEQDAKWGRKHPAPVLADKNNSSQAKFRHIFPALDDARLFLHSEQNDPSLPLLWVSYREGPGFGYEAQVLNPIHISFTASSFSAHVKASETTSFCCGRNMALLEEVKVSTDSERLQSLTWVDPVTVINVDTTPHVNVVNKAKNKPPAKKKTKKVPKSHIHGTNAFMVYLPDTQEYLGIGHFHRPNDRDPNEYARFGHHYTHCFFTIRHKAVPPKETDDDFDPSTAFALATLSQEFVLPAATTFSDDAEIIQFLSGLELDEDGKSIIIAYGINDCEAAVVRVQLSQVRTLLKPVTQASDGTDQQVINFMQQLKNQP